MTDDLRDLERLVEAAGHVREYAGHGVNCSARLGSRLPCDCYFKPLDAAIPAARACLERLKAEDGVSSGPVASYQREGTVPHAPPAVDLEALEKEATTEERLPRCPRCSRLVQWETSQEHGLIFSCGGCGWRVPSAPPSPAPTTDLPTEDEFRNAIYDITWEDHTNPDWHKKAEQSMDLLLRVLAEARAGRAAREALEVLAGVCRRLGDEDLLAVDVMVLLGMDAALAKAENALKGGAQ